MEVNSESFFRLSVIDQLCPFFFILDEHDRIQERGSRFNFVYPDVPSNAIFDDYFSVIDSSDSLVNHLNRKSVCVITRKSTCRSMKLKPIVLDENRVLYVGYPILTTGVSLKDYNLTINDLPQHDTVIEMLFLLEGMKRSMTESEEYIHSLTQLNNQLKQYNRRYKHKRKPKRRPVTCYLPSFCLQRAHSPPNL